MQGQDRFWWGHSSCYAIWQQCWRGHAVFLYDYTKNEQHCVLISLPHVGLFGTRYGVSRNIC